MKQLACYNQRSRNLAKAGFPSYHDYLASKLWRIIRAAVLFRDNRKCYKCQGKATQVHHTTYSVKTLLGWRLSKLLSVCDSCHRDAEFVDGQKVSLHEANPRLGFVRSPNRKPRMNRQQREAARRERLASYQTAS